MNIHAKGRRSSLAPLWLIVPLALATAAPVASAKPAGAAAPSPTQRPVALDVRGTVNVRIATPPPPPKPTPSPTPSPSPTPTPLILQYPHKTMFVVALASDPPTATKISNEIALQVNGYGGASRNTRSSQAPFSPNRRGSWRTI